MMLWIDRHYTKFVGMIMFIMLVNMLCLNTGWNVLLGAMYLLLATIRYRSRLWKKQSDSAV